MSFGSAYGSTPYGYSAPSNPSGDPVRLHSARKIDAVTGRYEVEPDGEFRKMSGTAQRILLITSKAMKYAADVISPASREDLKRRIEADLSVTAKEAEILSVTVSHNAPGSLRIEVSYKDLLTGANDTVEASL